MATERESARSATRRPLRMFAAVTPLPVRNEAVFGSRPAGLHLASRCQGGGGEGYKVVGRELELPAAVFGE